MRCPFAWPLLAGMFVCCPETFGTDPDTNKNTEPQKRPASTQRYRDPEADKRQRNREVLRLLNSTADQVRFDSTPLGEVFGWFKKKGLTNLMVNWKVLENSGEVTRETPVTLELEDLPLGELLDHVLAQASGEVRLEEDQLTYHVFDGIVSVSSRADFDRQVYTRTYYVEDLLYPVKLNALLPFLQVGQEFAYVSELDPEVAGGAVAQRPVIDIIDTGVQHGPGDPGYGRPDFKAIREAELAKLIGLLQTIRPRTWVEGGGKGTISAFGENLVINQTIEMHEIIGGAFEKVREERAEKTF